MKFTISHYPEERQQAEAEFLDLLHKYPAGKAHKSDQYTPCRHLYLAVRNPLNPSNRAAYSLTHPPDSGIISLEK